MKILGTQQSCEEALREVITKNPNIDTKNFDTQLFEGEHFSMLVQRVAVMYAGCVDHGGNSSEYPEYPGPASGVDPDEGNQQYLNIFGAFTKTADRLSHSGLRGILDWSGLMPSDGVRDQTVQYNLSTLLGSPMATPVKGGDHHQTIS